MSSTTIASQPADVEMPLAKYSLLVRSARQVVQVTASGEQSLRGREAMNSLAIVEGNDHSSEGVSIVVDRWVNQIADEARANRLSFVFSDIKSQVAPHGRSSSYDRW
jgi:hypothetical protein